MTEEDIMEEAWKRCTFYTNRALGFSTGALYVKGTDSEGSVEKVQVFILTHWLSLVTGSAKIHAV